MSWTNDAFWNIGNNDGDRDVYWLDKYNVSASGGITFDSRTVADKTGSAEFAFTGTGSYNFRTYDKGVGMTLNGKYYVFTHSSGSLSMSAEKTLNVTTNYSNFGFIGHPTDDDTIYRTVGNGIVQKMSWNNSTDTLTVDTTTTAPAGIVVRGAHSFFTYDGSTYKLAMVYWDNTNTTWKIRHFAIDLSSYTDVTLSGTVTPSSPDQPRHYVGIPKKVKLNEYIQSTSDASGNLAVFSITYDGSGSSFTENTAITQAPPSGNYLRGVGFTNHIADNVFATQVQWTESAITTNRDNYIYFWKSSSGTLTQLGSVLVNDPDTENAGNGRGGFELSPDGSFLYVANEGSDNSAGVEDAPVVSVIKRGT
jgi:hypothetical protein